jgi:hypothetical protein
MWPSFCISAQAFFVIVQAGRSKVSLLSQTQLFVSKYTGLVALGTSSCMTLKNNKRTERHPNWDPKYSLISQGQPITSQILSLCLSLAKNKNVGTDLLQRPGIVGTAIRSIVQ